jgi:hypothetical protein
MDEHDIGRSGAKRLEPGANRGLPCRAPGNRRQQVPEAGGRGTKQALIVGMNDRLHRIDLRMRQKRTQSRADDHLSGDGPILLGHFTPGAMAAPGCDNDSRNPPGHE